MEENKSINKPRPVGQTRRPRRANEGPQSYARPKQGQSRRGRPGASGPRGKDRGKEIHRARSTSTLSAEAMKDAPLRLVPLGGLEEIGRNMMFLEYKNEIIVIDAGLQFPAETTPGVDFIIPNTEYLEQNKSRIRAVIITHGHLDHIGAIPYVMPRLGYPPIYTSPLSKGLIEKRQEDFPNSPKLKIITVEPREVVKISENITVEFFSVEHTIPDSIGVVVKTPVGNVVNLGDFKIEYDENGEPQHLDEFERVANMGVDVFTSESTNADINERSPSEKVVEKNLEELFLKAHGRIIVAMFASVLTRIAEIIKIAEKQGRVVALSGYSMKSNVAIAQNLGYIKSKPGTIVPIEDIRKYRDDKLLILSTGAQGEENASLMKIITGEHRQISIKPGDTVILSASVIPGNESSVQIVKDDLARQGAIIFTTKIIDIHSSGHAPKPDLQLAMKLLRPKYLVPIHGFYYKRFINAQNGLEIGIPRQNIFLMDNGQVAELRKDSFRITEEAVPASYVFVDGLGVGDVEEVVLRDRRSLAEEGMVVVIVAMDRKNGGRLVKNPDIISRGFIYLKENQGILDDIRKKIRAVLQRLPQNQEIDSEYIKTLLKDQLGQLLYQRTKRRPMILPVIIEL